jgi:hypothetical protein
VRNVDELFFMHGWTQCGLHKKHAGTRYTELVFLHPVGSTGHVVHYGASGARNVQVLARVLRFPLRVFRSTWPRGQVLARVLRFFLSSLSHSVLISEQQSAPKVCFSVAVSGAEFWSPGALIHTTVSAQLSLCKDRECARGLFSPGLVFILSVCGHQAEQLTPTVCIDLCCHSSILFFPIACRFLQGELGSDLELPV